MKLIAWMLIGEFHMSALIKIGPCSEAALCSFNGLMDGAGCLLCRICSSLLPPLLNTPVRQGPTS